MASTRITQYYVTEAEVAKLFGTSGLPAEFQRLFSRDYVSLKADSATASDSISGLSSRVGDAETDIASQEIRIAVIETDLPALRSDFDAHAADNSAHGANGNILGTNDFAQLLTGGSVMLAGAVAASPSSAVNVTLTPTAAGAGYVQATAQTWVDAINEHKTAINLLNTNLDALISLFNASLTTEQTALQRA